MEVAAWAGALIDWKRELETFKSGREARGSGSGAPGHLRDQYRARQHKAPSRWSFMLAGFCSALLAGNYSAVDTRSCFEVTAGTRSPAMSRGSERTGYRSIR
jgi:hypothetical protein